MSPPPGNDRLMAGALVRMFAAFPSASSAEVSADLRLAAYYEALGDVPAWAVNSAVARVIRGDGPSDGRFSPTPPQLSQLARAELEQTRRDLADIAAISDARPLQVEPDEDERARVAAGFDALRTELAPAKVDGVMSARVAFAERCAALGIDPDDIPDARPSGNRLSAPLPASAGG